jgi:hypothetical protein
MGSSMTTIAISKPALLSLIGTAEENELREESMCLSWRCGCLAIHADLSYLWQPCRDHRKSAYWVDFSDALSA